MAAQPDEDLQSVRRLMDEQQTPGGPGPGVRRFVLRRSGALTFRLVAAIRQLADAVEAVDRRRRSDADELRQQARRTLDAGLVEVDGAVAGLRSEVAAVSADLRTRLDHTGQEVAAVADRLQSVAGGATATADALTALTDRLAALERTVAARNSADRRAQALQVRTASTPTAGPTVPAAVPGPTDGLDDETYLAFEGRFRGSREEIRARQRDAVEYVRHFTLEKGPLLDLACGRGEWLDVLRSEGIAAYGVDANPEMIADAAAAGLDVQCADALTHLAGVTPGSLQGISAFHFVEHIPLGVLVRMLDDSLVALRPGGSIVLESPNPTNLMVGSASFYLDPTHLRPVHPEFLRFLAESRGFVDVQIHFVHPAVPAAELIAAGPPEGYADERLGRAVSAVETFIYGAQDYVLVGRRPSTD